MLDRGRKFRLVFWLFDLLESNYMFRYGQVYLSDFAVFWHVTFPCFASSQSYNYTLQATILKGTTKIVIMYIP